MQSESKTDTQERLLLLDFMKWLDQNGLAICKQSFGQWRPEGTGNDIPVQFSLDRRAAKAAQQPTP
jgi:hypothetical protein